ncbi:MAG TPA: hypothetical protein VH374_00705 [Polyangia bacterium]|jgi:hypothetical protein|nr:hypothetical protein [Polyangia bacterium]
MITAAVDQDRTTKTKLPALSEVTVSIRSETRLIATVRRTAGGVSVSGDGGPSLTCAKMTGGAATCRTGDGAVVAEMKVDDPSASDRVLRLLAAGGALRWKIHVQPDKLVLSDKEDGGDAWTITRKPASRARVIDAKGKSVGGLKPGPSRSTVTVETVDNHKYFTVEGAPGSIIGALLLIPPLAQADRLLLMAALFAHGI